MEVCWQDSKLHLNSGLAPVHNCLMHLGNAIFIQLVLAYLA